MGEKCLYRVAASCFKNEIFLVAKEGGANHTQIVNMARLYSCP